VLPVGLVMHRCHWFHSASIAIAVVVVVVENCMMTCYTNRHSCHFASLLELLLPGTAAQVPGTAEEAALDIAAAALLDIFEGPLLDTVEVERPD